MTQNEDKFKEMQLGPYYVFQWPSVLSIMYFLVEIVGSLSLSLQALCIKFKFRIRCSSSAPGFLTIPPSSFWVGPELLFFKFVFVLCHVPNVNASLSGEAANTNFIVFGLTRPGFEPTIYRTRGEHANNTSFMRTDISTKSGGI
jgi:hypothetical protein